MSATEIRERYGDEFRRIALGHGATTVRLFGSSARDEASPTSDVDVLVDLETGRTLLDLVAIKQDLEDLIGKKVDVVTFDSISPYLRDQILAEAVEL